MVRYPRFYWYLFIVGGDWRVVKEDVSCLFEVCGGRERELTFWACSVDETSTRAPRPLGERSEIEQVLRYIPIVGLM